MKEQDKKRVIIFGSTGMLGFQITNKLLEAGFLVRVFVRSVNKLEKLFGSKIRQFQKIVQGDISSQSSLQDLFDSHNPIHYAISALGARPQNSSDQIQIIEYRHQVNIAWQCKRQNVGQLILMSAALMERPYHPITVFLNTIIPNTFHWKVQAQNHIRQLGINYAIIRPPYLSDANEETQYELGQGDKLLGKITRKTVANLVRDMLSLENLSPKITFQCTSTTVFKTPESKFGKIISDDETNIVKSNHKRAKYICWTCLVLLILAIIGLIIFLVVK